MSERAEETFFFKSFKMIICTSFVILFPSSSLLLCFFFLCCKLCVHVLTYFENFEAVTYVSELSMHALFIYKCQIMTLILCSQTVVHTEIF